MLTLLARAEPDRAYGMYGYAQVALYMRLCDLPKAVFPFNAETKPRRGTERVTLNGFRYKLEWLPDLIGPPIPVGELRLRALHKELRAS